MRLRIEIFPSDLDATALFYTRVLGFTIDRDERDSGIRYLALKHGEVLIGAAGRLDSADPVYRRPPTGVEIVLEVDDFVVVRDQVERAGWPIDDDLREQPWGLRDFRILDPDGYYLRITELPRT